MPHAEFQTPVGEIAPYIARNADVPTGTDAGSLTVLLRAPPNANVHVVQVAGYGPWGNNVLPYFYLIPPAGSTELAVGSPNTYPIFNNTADLDGSSITAPQAYYPNYRMGNSGAAIWIPAGWAMAVGPDGTTSVGAATFSAVGILYPSQSWGSNRR